MAPPAPARAVPGQARPAAGARPARRDGLPPLPARQARAARAAPPRAPARRRRPPLAEFLLDPRHGQLARCVAFLNRWAARSRKLPGVVLLRYEDLHADAAGGLRRAAGLLGDFAEEEIRAAVAFAAFDSLREKEARGFFRSGRLRPGDPGDPDSFKVRRGRVGGWRDYLTAEQAARVDDLVAARLDPALGYGAGRPPAPPPRAGRSPRTG